MAREFRVVGPPGTGKTRYLTEQARRAVEKHGPDCVLVCSLTKAAAREAAGRGSGVARQNIGTLHSLCYRMLDDPKLVDAETVKAWNETHHGSTITAAYGAASTEKGEALEVGDGDNDGDRLLREVELLRARCVPREEWDPRLSTFSDAWDEHKRETGTIDFTDMIDLAPDSPPAGAKVLLVDEAQDHSALEMRKLRAWAEHVETFVVVGDPYQCQPPGTIVETTCGPVQIEQLVPGFHRLISFSKREGAMIHGDGCRFSMESREYHGDLLKVTCDGVETLVTPEHLWSVRIRPRKDLWCLYLMRRGDWWRVGTCKLHRSTTDGSKSPFGVRFRLYVERGDDVWILSTFDSNEGALSEEQIASCRWSLPQTCFEPSSHVVYTRASISRIFSSVTSDPAGCLTHYGRNIETPFLRRGDGKVGVRVSPVFASSNLLPECMELPVWTGGRKYKWAPFSLGERFNYSGPVYSLGVEKHHHYVVGRRLVTHNCLYSWRGSDPTVLAGKLHKVLGQSYRVPRAVQREALALIRRSSDWRDDITYEPRDEEGAVGRSAATYRDPGALVEALGDVPDGESTMFLASCDYMLDPLKGALRAAGVPYHNPYTNRWNPIGEKAIARVRALLRFAAPKWGGPEPHDFVWTVAELREWLPLLREAPSLDADRGALLRGVGRAALEALGDATTEAALRSWIRANVARRAVTALMDGDVEWLTTNLLAAPGRALSYPLTVVTHRGWSALLEKPRVILGTIHSAKGGECEHVVLFPDLSAAGYRQLMTPGWDQRDAIYRMIYVAMTRASRTLTLAHAASPMATKL